ncbi:2,3-diaminopropionate biosynthesis protein SbnB [Brevibacillus dissolubilis]|uniref:2,3-diaminopropionate biosynthesis protein SbnB n=1 Tax=Brevibacillus dissolubilis TaxID=1844116 RepID=UPI0011162100|nr:2,3-diaminopropionate biosynthesis protein SbnB [Brevibacillus dissolubilis]
MSNRPTILYLSQEDIISVGGASSDMYVTAVQRALELHAKRDFVQPLKPYLRVDAENGHIADRIIAMPAYVGGEAPVSGLKWIGSKHDNPSKRGMERASGLVILNDPVSNYPIAVLEASLISGMRTAAVTVLGARHLAKKGFQQVACMGCGVIARMQLTSLLEQFPHITTIHLYDLNAEAAQRLGNDLRERFNHVEIVIAPDAESAVRKGEVVVTSTVVDKPYLPFEWLQKGAFVSNISIMDVHKDVFLLADKVIVDDWDQSNREKKVINQLVEEGKFSREKLHAELGEILIGRRAGRESDDEIILLNPMGMAVEDIASAQEIYQKAVVENKGVRLPL